MGFPDRPSNIQALQMANGDVNQVPISPISSRVWGRWEEMGGDGRRWKEQKSDAKKHLEMVEQTVSGWIQLQF